MKENQTQIFSLNGLPKCKMFFSIAMMFFLLYIGLEKVIQTFSLSGWIFGVLRWWLLGTGLAVTLASISYFALHKKLTLAIVDDDGITYLWGMLWSRKRIEVAWENIGSVDVSMVYKKNVMRPVGLLSVDMGFYMQTLKIAFTEPHSEKLARQIEDVNKRFWWDSVV